MHYDPGKNKAHRTVTLVTLSLCTGFIEVACASFLLHLLLCSYENTKPSFML